MAILIVASDIFPTIDNITLEFIAADAKTILVSIVDALDVITTLVEPKAVFTIDVTIEAAEFIADEANDIFIPTVTTLDVQFIADEAYAIFVPTAVSEEVALITTNDPSLIVVPAVTVVESRSEIFAEAKTILLAVINASVFADAFIALNAILVKLIATLPSIDIAADINLASSAL